MNVMPPSPLPTSSGLSTEQLAEIFAWSLRRRPLTPAEAAELRGLKINTLEQERCKGLGPRYFKSGRRVLYAERDVLEWLFGGARQSTAENVGPVHPASAQSKGG